MLHTHACLIQQSVKIHGFRHCLLGKIAPKSYIECSCNVRKETAFRNMIIDFYNQYKIDFQFDK